jgi:hypothetical protein
MVRLSEVHWTKFSGWGCVPRCENGPCRRLARVLCQTQFGSVAGKEANEGLSPDSLHPGEKAWLANGRNWAKTDHVLPL